MLKVEILLKKKFNLVATGGTFDCIHQGHLKLLFETFRVGQNAIIGLTSDDFIKKFKSEFNIRHNYEKRLENLKQTIFNNFENPSYEIVKLEDYFGPVISSVKIEAIVVSEETYIKTPELNRIRVSKNLKPLKVVVIKMVNSKDGRPLSSTRIRQGEIDEKGNILCD